MKVINKDKNGNVIPDLSKAVMPKQITDLYLRMLNEAMKGAS